MASKIKDMRGHNDDSYVMAHYTVAYGIKDDDRYKHIDELLLYDGKRIKATMGPIDLGIIPYNGLINSGYIVPEDKENRIDLIALKFYGSSKFWWILCYINNISDPLNIPVGTNLIIPRIDGIRKFPNPLS